MKILYYDCFCGISGDMNLAALLDLGVDSDYIRRELSKLNLDSEYELTIKKDIKKGITGTRVDVVVKSEGESHIHHSQEAEHSHNHAHLHSQEAESHTHVHTHSQEAESHNHVHTPSQEAEHHHSHHHGQVEHHHHHQPHHEHRNLKDIEDIINASSLSEQVKIRSLQIFMKVAQAEAKVHGKSLYEVHFHEVGATDSIIDIVGAAIALDALKVDKVMASSIQLGGGFVKCAHGLIPVPAPATVEILQGIPVKTGVVNFETTTPTGAAILAASVETFTDHIDFSIDKIGYGIGHRELSIPNVLRVYLSNK